MISTHLTSQRDRVPTRLATIDGVKANDISTLLELQAYDLVEELFAKEGWKDYINHSAILEGKINPNIRDANGWSALMYTSWNNLSKVALKLIETGKCDYNLQNRFGDREGDFKSPSRHTVLMYARRNNLIDVINRLKAN